MRGYSHTGVSDPGALNGFNKELLARHIKTCVSEDIREGNEEAVDELCELLKKLMK